MELEKQIREQAQLAKQAAGQLANLGTPVKNKILLAMADALLDARQLILEANQRDIQAGRKAGLSNALLDRLLLTDNRLEAMAIGLRQVAALPDPVGEVLSGQRLPNGLEIRKVRVPFGVVGMIYEARPNVTVDAAALCLKSGNAALLRGGSEALQSNIALMQVLRQAGETNGLPAGAIQLIETTDREAVKVMLRLNGLIDVAIPRGGAGLIRMVVETSTVPVIETGIGVCHTFVDAAADLGMAQNIAFNAKVSRPGVCNAMETLLVHKDVAEAFLPPMLSRLAAAEVEIRGCPVVCRLYPQAIEAADEDWSTEYSDLILSVRVVDSLEEALAHIAAYGTRHSEAIVTNDYRAAKRFQQEVDAAAVYVNASTRFTDGFEFGFGAEIGISTQKLHARGPMGLVELTSIKYLVDGSGQIR